MVELMENYSPYDLETADEFWNEIEREEIERRKHFWRIFLIAIIVVVSIGGIVGLFVR